MRVTTDPEINKIEERLTYGQMEVTFTEEMTSDIVAAAQERGIDPHELVRQAVILDLFR